MRNSKHCSGQQRYKAYRASLREETGLSPKAVRTQRLIEMPHPNSCLKLKTVVLLDCDFKNMTPRQSKRAKELELAF